MKNIKSKFTPIAIDWKFIDNHFYTLLSYIEGIDAEFNINNYSEYEQYQLGLKAGKVLKEIHSTTIENKNIDWASNYDNNVRNIIQKYEELILDNSKYKVDNFKIVKNILLNESYRIYNRDIVLCHGDFHLGNMLIDNGDLYVIDFGSSSLEDPYEEYDRFAFTLRRSIPFANGQIHGYFNGNPDEEFFNLIRYYTCRNYIASITWSIPFGDKEVQVAMENINLIDNYYDDFKLTIPNYYIDINNIDFRR